MSTPEDSRVKVKEDEKVEKYQNLAREVKTKVQQLWWGSLETACGEIVDIRGRSFILGAPATCQSNQ